MCNNKLLSRIAFAIVLLVTVVSQRLQCEAYALKSNNVNSLPPLQPYPKGGFKNTASQVNSKLPVALPPTILSDYYNSLISNSGQYLRRLPSNNWPQTEFIPLSNVAEDEYENGDEYYDDNTDQVKSAPSDIYYGNDAYQPDGWFNGPVIYDTPDSNAQNDEENDAQLNNLMISYLFNQFEKLNKQKELSEKRVESKIKNPQTVTQSSVPSVTSLPSTTRTITTNATPKKLTSKQFRMFQRGQKEFPLLRPASDNDNKNSENPEWPTELDEKNLSEEDSLMSLTQKGQSRTVRDVNDVLTTQLDNLKKEGPKMH